VSQPRTLALGPNCSQGCPAHIAALGYKRTLIIASPSLEAAAKALAKDLNNLGVETHVYAEVNCEPTVSMFSAGLEVAGSFEPDSVIGIGGGSPLDFAKLIAALAGADQKIQDAFGINLLHGRNCYLVCLPTTAGTGSEVSPNAILLDESEQLKKGVISPYLVPDATYIDPLLTLSMPPHVTAATGLDALTHCIEAYTNKFAHPYVDLFALEGIRLIAANLARAVRNGTELEARESMSRASMYGGLCLGPVNTAAVHALSYPLGSEFHVAHGISNAVLLPHVMEFNIAGCPERYAQVALALGAEPARTTEETAMRGIEKIRQLFQECGIPTGLGDLSVPESVIPVLAQKAMSVTRLLDNNPRQLAYDDAVSIYRQAFSGQYASLA
jgi:alcohol dehydrogenase